MRALLLSRAPFLPFRAAPPSGGASIMERTLMARTTAAIAALAAAVLAAAAGVAAAQQNPSNGTESGTNTNSPMAGTGNAGDRTAQVGSTPSAAKPVHRHHRRHHKAKAPAAAASQ